MNAEPSKRALITGASNGLGKALVDALAASGWQITAIDLEKPDQPQTERFIAVRCDLSDRAAVDALLEELATGEGFDLVIHNAAISATGAFENIPVEVHHKLLRLNAETPMVMTAALAAAGKLKTNGRVAFISSLSHFTGYPGAASYAASKDAIAIYAKSIRKPFARQGIKVSCVFPGPMRTGHAERHSPRGARAEKRMPPEFAARYILQGIWLGLKTITPGGGPKIFALFGKIAPWASDRAMRRIIFDNLDKEVF